MVAIATNPSSPWEISNRPTSRWATPAAQNVGVVAFSAGSNPERPDKTQLFGRLQNFGSQDVTVTVNLILLNPNRNLLDAAQVRVPAGGTGGVEFTIDSDRRRRTAAGTRSLPTPWHWTTSPTSRSIPSNARNVLVVTTQNDALETVLATTLRRASWPTSKL